MKEPKEPLTNKGWLQTASTKQLAEWIYKRRHDRTWIVDKHKDLRIKDIVKWLKRPHKER